MRMRTRKLVGAAAMIGFVVVYSAFAMALAQARPLHEASPAVQMLAYAIIGLAWILPLMPLIRWMQRPDL